MIFCLIQFIVCAIAAVFVPLLLDDDGDYDNNDNNDFACIQSMSTAAIGEYAITKRVIVCVRLDMVALPAILFIPHILKTPMLMSFKRCVRYNFIYFVCVVLVRYIHVLHLVSN